MVVTTARPTQEGNGQAPDNGDAPQGLVPFVRGSRERTEPFHDATTAVAASTRQVGPEDVLAHGLFQHVLLLVELTGGDGSTTAAVAGADEPFSVLSSVELLDVNGNPITQLDGYELAICANKYGAYVAMADPRKSPAFSALDANGDGAFIVRVPVQISGRDALGVLKNSNAGQTYKLRYNIAPASEIFDTEPAPGLPDVRVRAWLESWTQPKATDLFGNPVSQLPPAHGTQQFWSKFVANIEAGQQTIRLPRVGNLIRNIGLIFRDAAGDRDGANLPDVLEFTYDGNTVDNIALPVLRHRIAERYQLDGADDAAGGLDTGVLWWDFCHDLDGIPGFEMRDGYLPTTQATELTLRGTFGASGRLTVVTNDVAATGGIYAL